MARDALKTGKVLAAACLFLAWTLAAPVAAQAAGAWLVMVRPQTAFPGGIELKWEAGGRWWELGLELDSAAARPQAFWVGRQWALGPDTLSRVAVQGGYSLGEPGAADGGPWVGVSMGQQWVWRPVMVEFGTALRVPTKAPYAPWWETTAAVGLAW